MHFLGKEGSSSVLSKIAVSESLHSEMRASVLRGSVPAIEKREEDIAQGCSQPVGDIRLAMQGGRLKISEFSIMDPVNRGYKSLLCQAPRSPRVRPKNNTPQPDRRVWKPETNSNKPLTEAHGGQVQKLFRPTPLSGQYVPGEEGGPSAAQGVEVTPHHAGCAGRQPLPRTKPQRARCRRRARWRLRCSPGPSRTQRSRGVLGGLDRILVV